MDEADSRTITVNLPSGRVKLPVPVWAEKWFEQKQALKLSQETIVGYLRDLKGFALDLGKAGLPEIQNHLASYAGNHSPSHTRRVAITVRQVLESLHRSEDAEKIKLPRQSDPRIVVYSSARLILMRLKLVVFGHTEGSSSHSTHSILGSCNGCAKGPGDFAPATILELSLKPCRRLVSPSHKHPVGNSGR